MRVTHLVPATFGPKGIFGGAERYVLEMARHMAEIVPTTLLSFADEPREETLGALRIKVLGPKKRVRGSALNPWHRGMIRELLHTDVIHCHQTHVLASSLAALQARLTGKKVFTSELGGGGWDLSAYINTNNWYHGHLHISDYSRRHYRQENDARQRHLRWH